MISNIPEIGKASGFFEVGGVAEYAFLYSPSTCTALPVKRKELERAERERSLDELLQGLLEKDRVVDIGRVLPAPGKGNKFIALMLTTACNSNCNYCYAKTGQKPVSMSFETAARGIDFIVKDNPPWLELLFHGGGEPTVEFDLMNRIKRYAEEKSKNLRVVLQSSGAFSEEVLDWITENIDSVKISCDGPPKIQDIQRPLANGKKSSQIVERNIRALAEAGKKPIIKSVITRNSINMLPEIIEYLGELGVSAIAMDPFTETPESQRNNMKPLGSAECSAKLLEAHEFAEETEIKLYSSYLHIYKMPLDCGFCGPQFCLTPEGLVSSCLETSASGIGQQEFVYGRITGNGFEFDSGKIKEIQHRRVENMAACKACFLKETCRGGCAAEWVRKTGSTLVPSEEKCSAARETVKKYVEFRLKKSLED